MKIITKGEGNGLYYKDQLSSDDEWYSKRIFNSILRDKYNLSPTEYYNIINYGDKNYIHYCENPECHNITKLRSLIAGYDKCCSRSCHNQLAANNYYNTRSDMQRLSHNSHISESRNNYIASLSNEDRYKLARPLINHIHNISEVEWRYLNERRSKNTSRIL